MTFKQTVCILTATVMLAFCQPGRASAVYLMKNESAPFSGYLLDSNSELKARTAIKQNNTFKQLVEDQSGMINNLHQQNNVLNDKIVILSNNQENTLTKVLYFIGGVLVGGFVVNEIKK